MAKKKTLTTYKKAYTTAKTKYNQANTTYNKNKSQLTRLKKQLSTVTSSRERASLQNKIELADTSTKRAQSKRASTKASYTKAKHNLASFKKNDPAEKRKASVKLKHKIITIMQKEKPGYWKAKRPFIIPKYPRSIHSYVYIDNTSESETTTTDMTTNAIAPGQYINHFAQNSPTQHQIDGKLGGSATSKMAGLKKQFNSLKRWATNGTEIELHHGQRTSNSAILTSVAANFDAPRDNALPVSIALQDVKWARSEIKKKSKTKATKKKGNNVGDKSATKGSRNKKGSYLTIKKGDTYWGYHLRFGTSIAKLRSWNGFPDKKLPIGKKIRVK